MTFELNHDSGKVYGWVHVDRATLRTLVYCRRRTGTKRFSIKLRDSREKNYHRQ
jgi:hypothetical protein